MDFYFYPRFQVALLGILIYLIPANGKSLQRLHSYIVENKAMLQVVVPLSHRDQGMVIPLSEKIKKKKITVIMEDYGSIYGSDMFLIMYL